jgi:TolB protein
MALRLVDLAAAEDPIRTLAEGQPLYLSWAPDGDRVLTHIQNARVDIQQLDGKRQPLRISEASFPAPQWFPSGDSLLYAVSEGGKQRLIITGIDGIEESEITDFEGNISFTLSPDESQIAYAITPVSAGTAAFGPLFVVETESGRTRQLSDLPVLAFFWSPDSQKLAFLVVDQVDDDLRLRWRVWDGWQIRDYDAVLPSRTFLK